MGPVCKDEGERKMEETGFVKLLHEGDEVCFKGIYERYFAALCLYARGFVESEPVSADIAQDAFVALWRMRRNFPSEAAVRSFLYVTARNLSLNHIKHEHVKSRRLGNMGREMMEAGQARRIISAEVERQLVDSMEQLPRECRNVLKMSIEGKSYREIGEILDIAVSTVRNHRIRAVKLLKSRCCKIS